MSTQNLLGEGSAERELRQSTDVVWMNERNEEDKEAKE